VLSVLTWWQCCWAHSRMLLLNDKMIKDKFPIRVIDELLDELANLTCAVDMVVEPTYSWMQKWVVYPNGRK
jgi:hypothetical protein